VWQIAERAQLAEQVTFRADGPHVRVQDPALRFEPFPTVHLQTVLKVMRPSMLRFESSSSAELACCFRAAVLGGGIVTRCCHVSNDSERRSRYTHRPTQNTEQFLHNEPQGTPSLLRRLVTVLLSQFDNEHSANIRGPSRQVRALPELDPS
jgi:hypothetical protein